MQPATANLVQPAPSIFLTGEWQNLLMANYAIDPVQLRPYLPYKTELDAYYGVHYVSMVGFLFANTKVKGLSIPFHTQFEEVNLRFYVRYKDDGVWKRGVVFIKEIVPRRMITFVANTLYGEKYATHPMKHSYTVEDEKMKLAYYWKVGTEWNYLKATASAFVTAIPEGSIAEFITEHYWGYTSAGANCSGEYQVAHPRWQQHEVLEFESNIAVAPLYGNAFVEALSEKPRSVFVANGSPIRIMIGKKIR
jgi:uncharacterized protein